MFMYMTFLQTTVHLDCAFYLAIKGMMQNPRMPYIVELLISLAKCLSDISSKTYVWLEERWVVSVDLGNNNCLLIVWPPGDGEARVRAWFTQSNMWARRCSERNRHKVIVCQDYNSVKHIGIKQASSTDKRNDDNVKNICNSQFAMNASVLIIWNWFKSDINTLK